jgi:dTDP-4-dehydrorhamnose 3,5-epimerase
MHPDNRGVFTELFRREWDLPFDPVQWNLVHSEAGVLRGVHVHPRHDDFLVLVTGRASIGLRDLREGSSTRDLAIVVELDGETMVGIFIPHGVAHGFYFHTYSTHLYAVSHYWDVADEKGCLWSDPDLQIDWPMSSATVSERDAKAQSLSELLAEIAPLQPI